MKLKLFHIKNKVKRIKINTKILRDLWASIKHINICIMEGPETRIEKDRKNIWGHVWKTINLHFTKSQQTPSSIFKRDLYQKHYKLVKNKDKKKFCKQQETTVNTSRKYINYKHMHLKRKLQNRWAKTDRIKKIIINSRITF